MAWVYLLLAGFAEIFWAVSINFISGPKFYYAVACCVIGLGFSILFLWLAIKTIPLSIAYAIWTGIGIIGVYTFGLFVMNDSLRMTDGIFVLMILCGIIGLKLSTHFS